MKSHDEIERKEALIKASSFPPGSWKAWDVLSFSVDSLLQVICQFNHEQFSTAGNFGTWGTKNTCTRGSLLQFFYCLCDYLLGQQYLEEKFEHIDRIFNREVQISYLRFFTLAISKCYVKVRVLFFPRDNSHFTRQVAHFTRSWSRGKMLAFQPRGFVVEPVCTSLFFYKYSEA